MPFDKHKFHNETCSLGFKESGAAEISTPGQLPWPAKLGTFERAGIGVPARRLHWCNSKPNSGIDVPARQLLKRRCNSKPNSQSQCQLSRSLGFGGTKRWIQEAKSSFVACQIFWSLKNLPCHLDPPQREHVTWEFSLGTLSTTVPGLDTSGSSTCLAHPLGKQHPATWLSKHGIETIRIDIPNSQFEIATQFKLYMKIKSLIKFASNNRQNNCDE